jgi:hypothetical protein
MRQFNADGGGMVQIVWLWEKISIYKYLLTKSKVFCKIAVFFQNYFVSN